MKSGKSRSSERSGSLRSVVALCLLLGLMLGIRPVSSFAALSEECTDCHGTFSEVHGSVDHTATPGSGMVTLFEDTDHDDAGWVPPRPYFSVNVDCTICHASDLLAIHAENCATCHPSPYGTLGTWNGSCQQGGCHPSYHDDETVGHLPFEDRYNYANCSLCHDESRQWVVTQNHCLNCHAAYGPSDTTPPTTTIANAQSSYTGPAKVVFSISDNGKVGVGTTFYRVDGGAEQAGSHAFVSAPGSHQIEYWSMDQAGNLESPHKSANFTVVADTLPPTTTSDAKSSYTQGGTITLSAADNGTLGVKATYYSLNNGPTGTGTKVTLPLKNGTFPYTLSFWSEDWSGNIESKKTANFTVTSGGGTIRLVWGNSDVSGSPCSGEPNADASWTIRRDSWGGPVVATGEGACPNWSGFSDHGFPIGTTQYFVVVVWWNDADEYYDETWFGNISLTTPGQVVRLSY